MISFNEMTHPDDLGSHNGGVAIIALYHGKLLLLKEFRMAVNEDVYNLVAGRIEREKPSRTVSVGSFMKKRASP